MKNSPSEKFGRLASNCYFLILIGLLFSFNTAFSQNCNCIDTLNGYVINNKNRSEIPTSTINSNSTFYITGTFTVDGYLNLTNKTLIMGPKAKIVIKTSKVGNVNLQIINCTIRGCGCMWEGIEVNKRTVLTFTNNRIEDAYHAIHVNGGDIVSDKAQLQNIVGNTFNRNYIGIYLEKFFAINNIPWQTTQPFLVGNTFTSTSNLSDGYFNAGFNDCIGIYAINVRESVQIGKSQQSIKKYPPNIFSNLAQGVYVSKCDSSLVVIENNEFKNISESAISIFDNAEIPSQVFNNTFDNTTIGVSVETAPALVRNNTFRNIRKDSLGAGGHGIYLFNSSFEVFNNRLDNVDEGIRVGGNSKIYGNVLTGVGLGIEVSPNPKDYVAVFENLIKCFRNGITLYVPSPARNIDIYKNDITLDNQGDNLTITSGLWVDGFFDQVNIPDYESASIHDNTISILNGNYGMYLNFSRGLLFQKNYIATKFGSLNGTDGISLNNSHSNTFILNDIKMDTIGVTDLVGTAALTISKSTGNTFLCNHFENFGTSISFIGDCRNSILKNNKVKSNIFGITYNKDAISGPQIENGNQFIGSFSKYAISHAGVDSIVVQSLYKIGRNGIAPFFPESIFQDSALTTNWIETTDGLNWDDCKLLEDEGRSNSRNGDVQSTENELVIFPNPNHGDFILELPIPIKEPSILTIYDITGVVQKTLQVDGNQTRIAVNLSELQSGSYIGKLNHSTFSIVIVKMRIMSEKNKK